MMYQFAICDDVRIDAAYIESIVKNWAERQGYVINVDIYPSAEAFLFQYEETCSYDILILDIEMGNMNGMELARKIRLDNEEVQIVFVTGFPEYIAEGYEVSALHYLMKPVTAEQLGTVLDKAVRNLKKRVPSIIVSTESGTVQIPVTEICYAEAAAHVTYLVTKKRTYELQKSISEVETMLIEETVRCHRSYLAGLSHIQKITRNAVLLDNGKELPVSRSQYRNVNQAFITYFMGKRS